jgi:hypothetical protein
MAIEFTLVADFSTSPFQIRYPYRCRQSTAWKVSENKQRVKVYRLTVLGRKQLASERSRWEQVMEAMASILDPRAEESEA